MTSSYEGVDAPSSPHDLDIEERQWVERLSRMPAAKPILQHFAAFEAILNSGGHKGVEPPIDQVATWRRMFCWTYQRTDTPFGIVSPLTSSIPKCIAICNLSGNHAFYYSDNFNIGRILCVTPQENAPRIIAGVKAVFEKAAEIDASVIVLFCLPFQAGMERCYWEARTIRKTNKGAVKDGEMFFSINDREARAVSCTLASEHWPDAMFKELCKTFLSMVSPACLDATEDTGPNTPTMSIEQAGAMIDMLKGERKKLMEENRRLTEDIQTKVRDSSKQLSEIAKDAESKADARVAKVADASKVAEGIAKKKMAAMEEHNALLMGQLASQKKAADVANSLVAGMTLEHEQEINQATARQKALEAQVSALQSSHAKQVAEQLKARKNMERSHRVVVAELKKSVAESRKEVSCTSKAAELVTKSAEEARRDQTAAEIKAKEVADELLNTQTELEKTKRSNAIESETSDMLRKQVNAATGEIDKLKTELDASNSKMQEMTDEAERNGKACAVAEASLNEHKHQVCTLNAQLEKLRARLQAAESVIEQGGDKAKGAEPDTEVAMQDAEKTEASKEVKLDRKKADVAVVDDKNDKLLQTKTRLTNKEESVNAIEKRATAMESRMAALEAELKEAKKEKEMGGGEEHVVKTQAAQNGAVVVSGRGQVSPSKRHGKGDRAMQHEECRAQTNTVYMQSAAMQPPPQQRGFPPQGNFLVDPMLEAMISQLHSALQTITAAARSASSSTRAAEASQAKLEALMHQSGMLNYYEASPPMQSQFMQNGNGYGY